MLLSSTGENCTIKIWDETASGSQDSGPVETACSTDITHINGISILPEFESFQQSGGGGESPHLEKPRW